MHSLHRVKAAAWSLTTAHNFYRVAACGYSERKCSEDAENGDAQVEQLCRAPKPQLQLVSEFFSTGKFGTHFSSHALCIAFNLFLMCLLSFRLGSVCCEYLDFGKQESHRSWRARLSVSISYDI